jgi:endonuclease YncB( thermonuclease family)
MRFRITPLLFAVLFLSAAPALAQVNAFSARVVGIIDGDTITVLAPKDKEYKVRLAGIDAPEVGQEFGRKAREYLGELINGKNVTIVGKKTERDGELVAQVFVYDESSNQSRDVGYSVLTNGLAWHNKESQNEQTNGDRKRYAEGEEMARGVKLHIWSLPNPLPPWEHRKAQDPAANTEIEIEFIGNRNSRIYHWNPGCPDFFKIAEKNRVHFKSKEEAESAGYRAAKNCRN